MFIYECFLTHFSYTKSLSFSIKIMSWIFLVIIYIRWKKTIGWIPERRRSEYEVIPLTSFSLKIFTIRPWLRVITYHEVVRKTTTKKKEKNGEWTVFTFFKILFQMKIKGYILLWNSIAIFGICICIEFTEISDQYLSFYENDLMFKTNSNIDHLFSINSYYH